MPILPKCCCCAKLETGGYIIGGLGVLVGFLFIIGSIAFDHESNEVEDKELIPFVLVLAGIILMIAPIFLLIGTYKRNPRYVSVWLVFNILTIIMYLLENLAKGIFDVVIITAIQMYFWCCIFSLYQLFRADESLLPINNSIQMTQTNTGDQPPNYSDVATPTSKMVNATAPDYSSISIY